MSSLTILVEILYFILGTAFLVSNIFSIPGNLIIFLLTVGLKLIVGSKIFSWFTLIVVFVLFIIGEFLESYLGLRGARKVGVSKKAMIASFIGAIAGAIALAPFLLGIGAIIGAVLGAFAGTFIWVALEERKLSKAAEAGFESAKGRLKGTFIKGFIGFLMLLTSFFAIIK